MPAGKLGDLYGYRIIYLAELIANSYTGDHLRTVAISVYGGSGTVGFAIGLIFGGVLSSTIGWRWIFYVTAICSLDTSILAFLYVPDLRHEGSTEKVDVLGFLLITSGFILVIYTISDRQWHLARDPVTQVIGVLLIVAFLLWQFKATYPLVRPSWWRRQNVAVATATGFIQYAVFMGYIYVTTLMFQDAFGYTALQTSLYYIPMGISAFLVANRAGYIMPYVRQRAIMIIAALMIMGTNIGALFYSTEIGFWKLIFPVQLLMAAGLPLDFVGGQNALLASAPPSEPGTLGAVYNTASQLGSGVGSAIMTAVVNGVNKNGAKDINGLPGYHAAYYVNIGLLAFCVVICAYVH
ncbi:major facilitator superfamily domain-containing protein [Umbelopsis sp. PMI_123]|nr:major facilitator superfamily domain-containing protein [Umbelopsis sp. PMI_123]